jgi:hypothetical protein
MDAPQPPSRDPALRPALVAALLAAAWVLAHLDQPLVEDSLFWWVPQGLLIAEQGPLLRPAGALPEALLAGLSAQTTPPQWADGIPDYAHPPLWFAWLGLFVRLFGPHIEAIHLACLLPAMLAASGFAVLGQRLGGRWSGLALFGLPPFLAQLLRPELDLPLLAVTPWALLALHHGRWGFFALLGALAPWCKEPGVLLLAPALARAWDERRWRPEALAPLASLGAWALLHGAPAQPEHLPASLTAWAADLYWSLRIVFWEQGRGLLLVGGLLLGGRALLRPALRPALVQIAVWVGFFSVVGFFVSRTPGAAATHVRYFLPGMALAAVLLAGRHPYLALAGLFYLSARSPFGPEASLFGLHQAQAERAAAPQIAAQLEAGDRVWVGSYQAAALSQPWAGVVEAPLTGFFVYGPDTQPGALSPGDRLWQAAYGEPLGLLGRDLPLRCEAPLAVGEAWVRVCTVQDAGAADPG